MATLFDHSNRSKTARHATTTVRYEIARTLVEFLAALCFIIGSVFFFYPSLEYAGTWLFLVGSILFALRPTVRLAMEIHLSRINGRGEDEVEEKLPL